VNYQIKGCQGTDLSPDDVEECVSLLAQGGAVDSASARKELPRAGSAALVYLDGKFVGLGVIKRKRPDYASNVAIWSGLQFDSNMLELGYVAVEKSHQGKGLTHRIFAELLSLSPDTALFATTYHDGMKSVNRKAGFEQKGNEWPAKCPRGR
jgi:GNAT superfamily N-acetyltransferase